MLDRYERFSMYIAGAYRYVQKLEREEMEKYGLKGAYAQYLIAMRRYPDGVTATQLCEICDKDKAAVSRAVTEMEAKGVLFREGSNPYRAMLKLTEEGRKASDFVCQRAELAVRDAGKGLSDENREIFYSSLATIASNLQLICKDGIPGK
ncbi:MAG: MarR family transcriptional regulator [Clostridia bacterium]|nr:MarR family transcriptional regulator [Clostridia bacterium]